MIVATVMAMMVIGMTAAFLMPSMSRLHGSQRHMDSSRAFFAAEAGVSYAIADLNDGGDGNLGTAEDPVEYNGCTWFAVTTDNPDDTYTILSTAMAGTSRERIEVVGLKESLPASFYYAIFSGNDSGKFPHVVVLGGNTGGQKCGTCKNCKAKPQKKCLSPTKPDHDVVNGDVYANGDIKSSGAASVTGDVDATGAVTDTSSQPITGVVTPAHGGLPGPDIQGQGYASKADVFVAKEFAKGTVTKTNSGIETASSVEMNKSVSTTKDSTNPASIFATGVLNTFGTVPAMTNANYFLGDWYQSSSGETITITPEQNNKVYYVDGNLWVETNGYGPTIKTTDGSPLNITFVARGNLYFADQFSYGNAALDGVLFIAESDGESYTDVNGNNKFDAGEPILHDNGNGAYNGNKEGSGNIYWGDPNVGPLGVVNAFLYAENNFDDYALDTAGKPQPFTINGFMQAGNQIRINRDFAGGHAQMIVNYDGRIEDGTLQLPGIPAAGQTVTGGDVQVFSWQRR